tara:strand:+ start:2910 stop:3695 length:786 start_codon:yes stop_codon:yes gene_type:complete
MADKPNPFLTPTQLRMQQQQELANAAGRNPPQVQYSESPEGRAMRQAGATGDVILPWEQQNYVEAYPGAVGGYSTPAEHPYVAAPTRVIRKMQPIPPTKWEYMEPLEFNFRRAEEPTEVLQQSMPGPTSATVRHRPMIFAADEQIKGEATPEDMVSIYPEGQYAEQLGMKPGEVRIEEPVTFSASDHPEAIAEYNRRVESLHNKWQAGQALNEQERTMYRTMMENHLRENGWSDAQIQRQLSRIDPATGMLPPPQPAQTIR